MCPLFPSIRSLVLTIFFALLSQAALLHAARPAPLLALAPRPVPLAAAKLNVVVVVVDDLGWGDLSCQGSAVPNITPHIDALAARGVRFTNGYAPAAQCSPSRAGMLTGRYPGRLHITTWIGSQNATMPKYHLPVQRNQLALSEITLPEALKPLGYKSENLGKWHIGEAAYGPIPQGFDEEHGYCSKAAPTQWFSPYTGMTNVETSVVGEYITDRLGAEAVDFIERHQNQPFLVFLQNYGVHDPHKAKQSDIDYFLAKGYSSDIDTHNSAHYLAQLKCVDDNVGRIVAKLDELKLSERTLIVFISDNGATHDGSNAPYRAWKKWPFEGGIRVPFLMVYPPLIAAGTTNDTPVNGIDLMPTILDLAGLPHDRWPAMDGTSLRPLFAQASSFSRPHLFWHFPQIVADSGGRVYPYGIVREGNLKYIQFYTGQSIYTEKQNEALYDLAADPGETTDLAATRPADLARLRSRLKAHLAETGAQTVTPK